MNIVMWLNCLHCWLLVTATKKKASGKNRQRRAKLELEVTNMRVSVEFSIALINLLLSW
jgi:hypothetical protein